MTQRLPLVVAKTPYAPMAEVTLYEDTWEKHILPNRGGTLELGHLMLTLEQPSFVTVGTTNPKHVAFVNTSILSPTRGSPFVVFVGSGTPNYVATAGYRMDYRSVAGMTVLWTPQ